MKAIAVIDLGIDGGLFIYDVPEKFEHEQIEEFLMEQGHKMSVCSWGEFDGNINDARN